MSKLKKRIAVGCALFLLVLIGADQVLLHTMLDERYLGGHPVAPHDPPLFSDFQLERLDKIERQLANHPERFDRETMFDADLGWCPRPGMVRWKEVYDWTGSRADGTPLPRELADDERLVAAVGCSFTYGNSVEDDQTWGAALERSLEKVHVANFGYNAWGPDQALLRYRRDAAPLHPDEVWLGFYPGAGLRVSSQFPPLYYRKRATIIFFKPRFGLDEQGKLVLHPSPARRPEDLSRLIRNQRAFVDAIGGNDPWIARTPAAYEPRGSHWTHHFGLTRLWLTLRDDDRPPVRAWITDPSCEVYRLNRAIVLQLAREVEASGARFRLLFLPAWAQLSEVKEGRERSWAGFLEDLRGEGIDICDPTGHLIERGISRAKVFWVKNGHPSPTTYEWIVERAVEQWELD